jgi:hypothetical protein
MMGRQKPSIAEGSETNAGHLRLLQFPRTLGLSVRERQQDDQYRVGGMKISPQIQPQEGEHLAPPAATTPPKAGLSEDWLTVCIGLFVFLLSFGTLFRMDLLG